MRRLMSLLPFALLGSSTAACLIDAVTLPDTSLSYMVLNPGKEKRDVTVRVICDHAQDRYRLLLAGSVLVQPGSWEAELRPRRDMGEPLRVVLDGAAAVFGPGITFGGDWSSIQGLRTYTHTLTLRARTGQWVAGGDYVSDLRVTIQDL